MASPGDWFAMTSSLETFLLESRDGLANLNHCHPAMVCDGPDYAVVQIVSVVSREVCV